MADAIVTDRITKKFDGLVAVDNVSLKIPANQITGIIGPNGSGKTTFFNLLSGFFRPTSGKVVFNEQDITQIPPNKRVELGIVRTFQLVSVFNSLTVWENLVLSTLKAKKEGSLKENFFFTSIRKKRIQDKCMEVLKSVGLEKKACEVTSVLSYGDKRMLEIAIALSLEPKLLLLDEPLAGLSDHEIVEVLELIHKIKSNYSLVIIEHKISKIIDIVQTLHVMNSGNIICGGEPKEVINEPRVKECYWGKEE